MDIRSGDIGRLVFARKIKSNLPNVSMDGYMLNVLAEMDGKKSLNDICERVGMSMVEMRETVAKLVQHELIEQVQSVGAVLSKEFMQFLTQELSRACGPIGSLLVEDAVADMGCRFDQVPSDRAAELIELLAREIPRDEKKVTFQQVMLQKVTRL